MTFNPAPTDPTGKTCFVTSAAGRMGVSAVKHFAALGEAAPFGYMGDPSGVARAAVFLASDQSAYMTAQTIGVDGGNVLR